MLQYTCGGQTTAYTITFSLHLYMGSGDPALVTRPCKHPYLRSHLAAKKLENPGDFCR